MSCDLLWGKGKRSFPDFSWAPAPLCSAVSWFALCFQNVSEQASLRIPRLSLASPLLKLAHRVGNLLLYIPYLSVLVSSMWRPRGRTSEQRQYKEKLPQSYLEKKMIFYFWQKLLCKICLEDMYNTKECGNKTSFESYLDFTKGFLCRNSCKRNPLDGISWLYRREGEKYSCLARYLCWYVTKLCLISCIKWKLYWANKQIASMRSL